MYSIRWLGFGISHSLSRTVVHFFPCSALVSAPYPVNTKIEVFSASFGKSAVALEGARLHQPDGIKLEAAFPVVADGAEHGAYGVSIEVSSGTQRVDLMASQCIIEIISANGRIRYRPQMVNSKLQDKKESSLVSTIYKDSRVYSSLLLVNESSTAIELAGISDLPSLVAATNATEVKIKDSIFDDCIEYQSERDVHRTSSLALPSTLVNNSVAGFVIERDLTTQRVTSVAGMEIL